MHVLYISGIGSEWDRCRVDSVFPMGVKTVIEQIAARIALD